MTPFWLAELQPFIKISHIVRKKYLIFNRKGFILNISL